MNHFTLTADDTFAQQINYDHDAERAYRDVWLYDRNDEAKARVDANANAAMYTLPSMHDREGMALWAREHARMVAPHLADTPIELAQSVRDRLVDAGMKERYTAKMQELEASGQDSADDWYSLYAEMNRDVVQKAWDDARAREAAVADSLDRLGAYISGADLTPDEEEGKGFSQKDVDNVRSVLPAAEMAALDDMRAFARTYLRGLERLEDGEAIVRGLDDLEDELHEIVGQDENKAALMYNTVMDWAQRVADSDKIGAGDEFLLSIGNKLRTWGQERPRAMFAAVPAVGAAGAINTGALSSAAETIQEAGKEGKERELSRGILRAGAAKARTIGRNTGWWKGALRTGSAMAGDSAMYLIPAVGGALGTIDTLSTGLTDVPDMARAAGATDFGAGTQAMVDTGVQAAVELMPFGKIGGKGLSAFVRKVFGESVAKGTSGALAKWVVRHTQKSTMRALAAEAGAGMVEEALIEPLVGGALTLGLEEAVYALGAPQGEQSRKWTEHFAELSSMLTDPQQLAGLAIFTAALTGASTPAIRRNVKYFERSRSMWEAAGLKPEHVEEVLVSKTPMQTGRELLEQEEAQDAAGLWERRAKANEKILAEGKVLFMTGQSEAEMEAPELAQAYAAAWQEGVQAGVLPDVSANEDGTFTVRERGKAGKEDKVLVLTPAAADAYLQAAIAREEEAQFEQLKKELGEQGAREKAPNLRAMVQIGVSEIAGEAMRRQVAKHGRFDVADVEKQLPEHLAKLVRMRGGIDRMLAARISDWARGRVAALMEGGMSEHDAWASKDYAAGAVRSLGDWTGFAESFVHRTEKLANRDSIVTQVFRAQNNDVALVDGATVLGSTIFNVRGKGRAFGWLEDTTESVVDQLIQARGAKIYEAKKGDGMTRAEAERQALNELGEQVARARAAVLKADPSAKIFEVKKDDRMSVIEAFSDISNSAFLTSGVVPKWMRPMAEMMKANVVAANTALTLAKAWEAAIEADPDAVQDMRKVLDEVGIDVRDIVEETNISAEDIETWKMARAEARAVAYGPRGVGGEAVSEVVQQAEAEEAAIRAKEAPVSEERKEEVQAEVRAQEAHVERVYQGADEDAGRAPEEVRGVFVGDSCVYNAAGGFYMGLIDKSKLRDGIEQVKVGAKGKHGVIAGRELVGDFQASAAPLYVWKRKNGELWLISGRHRFELLLRDNGVSSHACYVFVEDAEHDEKWARMMDYENNMRDDQADEVTAAMYVRETGYGDAELRKRGLLRNESRSKRGALIGRWAREELWTRFVNGAVKPIDAEIICNLTKNLRDASRVEEIQRRCCMLLDEGKGWEYIGAMVQLMANKESVFLKQGLLDLGADFEADLARAAAWIEKNLRKLNEAISLVKQGRKLSGKKREEAERLGIATQMEGGEDLLADLEGLRAKFEMVGSYPDLVAQAQLYDGKTEVDPVGQLLEQQRAQREREQGLKELDAEAYLRAKQAEAVPTLSFSVTQEMADIKAAAEKDGTFMTAPNGKPTNLTEHQWLQVRTNAFKEWFGDWEKVADLSFDGSEYNNETCLKMLTEEAGTPFVNDETGIEAEINNRQRGKITSGKAQRKSRESGFSTGVHNFVAAHIRRLFKHAVHIGDYRDKNQSDDILDIKRFVCPVRIKGVEAFAYMTVKELKQHGHKIYTLELDTIERLGGNLDEHFEEMLNPAPSKEIVARVKALSKTYFENVSKVVDENGEPKVFYHHTNAEFTEFLHSKRGKTDAGWLGAGFYFYGIEDEGKGYGKNVMECFLNVREPYYASDDDMFRLSEADSIEESEAFTESLIEDGYDGVYYDGDLRQEMMVFEPNQIKSATDNRGAFDGSNPDITMSTEYEPRNLAAVHSLSPEKFLAALAKLVDDSKVSFSVVGEHAANWDELKERAFKGRDDGKLRVELDASGAKLKGGKHGQDAKVLAPRFRALVEFIREKINANKRWNAVVTDWKDNVPSIDSWEEVSFVRRVLEKAGITYQDLGALVNSGILLAVLEPKEEHIGAFLDKVERIDSLSGFDALEDVLDYPELYKAYPQLRKVPILWKKDEANRGLTTLSETGNVWITVRDGEDAERTLSTLLHETQHVIQFIEGFAVGGAGGFADMRAWMSDNGYLDQSLLLTNAELYRRLAGEIEARNVQKRAGWDANARQYYIPFNDTLEYAGQAIVIKASDLGYDNVSLSLTVEAQNALHLLEKRRDEMEAQVILEDMQKACERLSVVLAADDDPQVGNGLQVYAEMQALISATRKALPGKYLRQGNLNGLLAWAGVYARMAQNGAMPKRGAIKGEIYDRFVTELGKKNERMQLQGMSADEAREVMMGLGSTRLEEAFLKVGRDCAKRLDAFLKDRALERIEYLHELVYPKREPGQAWTRGKMDTTAYLLVEKVRAIIAGSRERRAKLEEELREKRREMRRVREAMESGHLDEEMGARKLTVMRGQMELMELNAMAEAAAKHAKTLEQLDQELAELDQDAEDYAQRERKINEEVALLKTFGNWYYKDAGEAVRAARVFEDIILRGKADWEDKLKLERERRAWLKAQIASHFTTADPDVENVRADDRAAFKGTMGSKAKAMAKGVMSFGHMLVYLRAKLGREFCDDQRAKLARIHDGFMGFNRELDGWMYRTLRDITGLDTKETQEVWLTQMEEVHDTGIMVTNSRREKIVLSYAEATRWLGLNKEAFEQERARMLSEAAQAKRKPMNVPTAEVMDELRELYLAYEADHRGVDEDKKQFHLTHEETWEEELRTTKGVLLFFLLTFEQPDYEHLLEANGMSGATLDQIRRYIGPKMVRWGYAMRDKLNEHGQLVAEVFERYTGIPFGARESYFKGVFDTGAMKERDERAAIEQGSAGAGTRTKYGSLIPRRYHKARVERVSATQVFVQAMQQQNNYVQTAEFVREWRGLLTDKDFAKRMEAELGADTMQMLRGCIETLEGAAAGDAAAARAATGVISKMLSGYAVTRLAGNVYTIIKQVSAILNAMAGGYVPEKMVEHGVLVQDMALRKVGFGEFLRSLARVLTLRGAIGKSEVAGQEYIRGRKLYEGKGLAHTAMLEANQKVAGYEPAGGWLGWTAVPNAIWSWLGQKSEKVKELGMEALGFMDAEMCTLSAMALADAVYRQGKVEDKEGLVPDEVLRARALQLAGMALDIAAQPQVRTQKGYWAASGAFGALAPTLYMFRSDTLSKVGLWGAQMASGEKLPAATSFLAFGVLNALVLALLRMMRGDLPDDDDEVQEMAVEFALNVLTNDASALPLVGETIGTLRNTLQGKHWAAQGGLGEMVLPFVTLGTDIYREVRNFDKDAPLDKHWATVGRLLRSLGASAAIFHESTTGPLANASSIAAAAAVAGNMSMVVKGLIKAMEDAED